MDTREEYEQLKRKNRNRLIGAIVLVAAIALILLAVTDKKTPPQEPEVKIAGKTQTVEKPADLPPPQETLPEKPAAEPIVIDSVAQPELPSDPVLDTPAAEKPQQTKPVAEKPQSPKTMAEKPKTATPPAAKKSPEKSAEKQPAKQPEKLSPQDILEGKTTASYFVQLGAFKTQAQADTQRAKLAQVGISSQIQQGKDKNGNPVYRVRTGSLNKADADKTAALAQKHKFDAMIARQ